MLLKRPEPYTDESLESYFIRVGNLNGYGNTQKFLSSLKRYLCNKNPSLFESLPPNLSTFNPCHAQLSSASRLHAIRELSQLVFKETVSLQRLLLNRAAGKYSPNSTALIRHNELLPRSLLRSKPAICPRCIEEFSYARYWWHFKGYSSCHLHSTVLIYNCHSCGAIIDYRDDGFTHTCPSCKEPLIARESRQNDVAVSAWLAGKTIRPLPNLEKSYRWGLIHWWLQTHESVVGNDFYNYWRNWPSNYHQSLSSRINDKFEYAPDTPQRLTAKYVLGDYLFSVVHLPDRDLSQNILLREIFSYLDEHLWDKDGQLANLRLSALDVALLLGTSREQVASLFEQRLLHPISKIATTKPPTKTAPILALGDVFCLWVTDFQTPTFNRATYVSRW